MSEDERRLRIVKVTPEFLIECCKPGTPRFPVEVAENPLPADARLVRCGMEEPRFVEAPITLLLMVHSREFEPVPPGNEIPEHPPIVFRQVGPVQMGQEPK